MAIKIKYILYSLAVVFLLHIGEVSFACTCIGKDKQTTETELAFIDIAVKGKIINVANFEYYDTIEYSLNGVKFDAKQNGYLVRKYKLFTLVIDKKFKSAKNMSDTIKIVSGFGNGDCGYEFEIGKDYIVYAEAWEEKIIKPRKKKRVIKNKVLDVTIANQFYTDICRLTQDSNIKELDNLQGLIE
jgi:hypothetical protein